MYQPSTTQEIIDRIEFTQRTLKWLGTRVHEDFANCKDQWHDHETGFITHTILQAIKTVNEELERQANQAWDNHS